MKKTVIAGAFALLASGSAFAAPSFVNGLAIPGNATDATPTAGANGNRLGFFSDIYYDTNRNEWWGLSDRGPGGGTINYDTRAQRFSLDINQTTGAISNFRIQETVLFNRNGAALNGIAPSPGNVLGNAFDPEGLVVNPRTGNLMVSDEYGPSLYEINRSTGAVMRTFTTPENLMPRNAAGVPNFASDAGNTLGKRTNRGFESLAISPDGKFTFALLQSANLDEGGGNGVFSRLVKFDNDTGQAVAQYAYRMDTAAQGRGTSALVAINNNEFYVLERNNRGIGVGAVLAGADKVVYRLNLNGATDVTNINLAASGASFTAISKSSPVLDLDANTLAALGNRSPEKWEGLAIGPRLANGDYLLLAGTDNDYSVTQNGSNVQFDVYFRFSDADPFLNSISCPIDQTSNCFFTTGGAAASLTTDYSLLPGVLHAYRISAAELGNFVAPVPLPGTLALLGLGALGLLGRTKKSAFANPSRKK
jgi:hypothetical protein